MNQPSEPIALQSDAEYRNLILDEARFSHAELEGTTFDACSFVSADLRNARLNGATFRDCNLTGVRIAGANLFGVTFERCKLMGVDFHDGITLTAASFTGCNLDYSNFRGVELDKMTFDDCTFVEADLSLASLRFAVFTNCDLTRVDLTETAFFQTDLRGSTLGGWNLRRDALDGIIVAPAQARDLLGELGILVLD
jgi:fluoroquinolone resistance protein